MVSLYVGRQRCFILQCSRKSCESRESRVDVHSVHFDSPRGFEQHRRRPVFGVGMLQNSIPHRPFVFDPAFSVHLCRAINVDTGCSQADLKSLQDAIHAAQMNADNAWMLVSAALVLLMTGPGLALVLWRAGAAEEHSRHHDAELRHDGPGHDSLGHCGLLAGLWARQPALSADSSMCSCAAWV